MGREREVYGSTAEIQKIAMPGVASRIRNPIARPSWYAVNETPSRRATMPSINRQGLTVAWISSIRLRYNG